jgi:hypothetical protein
MSHRVCRYHNTQEGCRRGNGCPFRHDSRTAPRPSGSREAPNAAPQHPSNRPPTQRPPRGVCDFYWKTGKCKHEFNCHFRHEITRSSPSSDIQTLGRAVPLSSPDQIAPYLTAAGLAKVSGPGTDIFYSIPDKQLDPNESHNYLTRFLAHQFRFTKAFDVYAFLKVLASATSTNSSWVCLCFGQPCFHLTRSFNVRHTKMDRSASFSYILFSTHFFFDSCFFRPSYPSVLFCACI